MAKLKVGAHFYHWQLRRNLGDAAFPAIVQSFWPTLEPDPQADTVFFIGGSVVDHLCHFPDARHAYFFGAGALTESALPDPRDGDRMTFYPRGPVTEDLLRSSGFRVEPYVGDTAFLLARRDVAPYDPQGPLVRVLDGFADVPIEEGDEEVAVAETPRTIGRRVIAELDEWIAFLRTCRGVVSSQVHPVVISLALGVPARLVPKDVRSRDINRSLGVDLGVWRNEAGVLDVRRRMRALSDRWVTAFEREVARHAVPSSATPD
jgi:hypothetical protein